MFRNSTAVQPDGLCAVQIGYWLGTRGCFDLNGLLLFARTAGLFLDATTLVKRALCGIIGVPAYAQSSDHDAGRYTGADGISTLLALLSLYLIFERDLLS